MGSLKHKWKARTPRVKTCKSEKTCVRCGVEVRVMRRDGEKKHHGYDETVWRTGQGKAWRSTRWPVGRHKLPSCFDPAAQDRGRALSTELGFSLEMRGGIWVVVWPSGAVRPASAVETILWRLLTREGGE